MKSLVFVTFVISLGFTACAPSPGTVATAMAQTQAALQSETPPPSPTATHTLTPEPPTSTPAETPTSGPDLRVVNADPQDILCTKKDFPVDGNYFLQAGDAARQVSNEFEIKAERDEYVDRTGRIDGWSVAFTNGAWDIRIYPDQKTHRILCSVESFQTIEGAQLAVREYNDAEIRHKFWYRYFEDSGQPDVGDVSFWIVNYSGPAAGLDFSYRNYRVTLTSVHQGVEFAQYDELLFVAQNILKKLENTPLIAP